MSSPLLAAIIALFALGAFCLSYGMWFVFGAPGALFSVAAVMFCSAAVLIKGIR